MLALRTSESSPLRVDFLRPADLGLKGRVGLTIAPGKKDAPRGWDRDLAMDLARLTNQYQTRLLVSLMEKWEYEQFKIAELFDWAKALGIDIAWLPIKDLNAPGDEAMAGCAELVEQVLDAARDGHTVVIHCLGGVGRSGLMAAACLVARGYPASRAIESVRAVREGAVEMEVQERWVAKFARHWATRAAGSAGQMHQGG